MFEVFIAFKYLIPRKKALSTSLISVSSVAVISLVVWLVLVFLSVTVGIEKNWLNKLTSLNAPLRISPTDYYYSSYYYLSDSIAGRAGYSLKNIREKAAAPITDPYSPDTDMEIPSYWPEKENADPVKQAYEILQSKNLAFQDYEISGALMRLTLNRENKATSYITQMTFLASQNDKNPNLPKLLSLPSNADFNHLLSQLKGLMPLPLTSPLQKLAKRADEKLSAFFHRLNVKTIAISYLPASLLPETASFAAAANCLDLDSMEITICAAREQQQGLVTVDNHNFFFKTEDGSLVPLPPGSNLRLAAPLKLQVAKIDDNDLIVTGELQGQMLAGRIPFEDVEILDANINESRQMGIASLPLQDNGVLLPEAMRGSGALIGDEGYLTYTSGSFTGSKENRIPILVAGFYDPGILPVGSRSLIVPAHITSAINAAQATFSPDGTPTNGIFVWFDNIKEAAKIKAGLQAAFTEAKIDKYWQIKTYSEYEFSKDLLEQFQSDRTLFTLIAAIILIVACSNIISLLVLLVNDKKKEIAALQAMGASKKSIVAIFGLCGIITGVLSSLIGTLSAILTLRYLHVLIAFLSAIQGHMAFNPIFFGKTLPNHLSYEALIFILIATPLISLSAGLIPALKASKLNPSSILRSE